MDAVRSQRTDTRNHRRIVALSSEERDHSLVRLRGKKPSPSSLPPSEDPSSATREVPVELRGRRVMTRLLSRIADRRAVGQEVHTIALSDEDERSLRDSAGHTFGAAGADAATRGKAAFRGFLVTWLATTVELAVTFDAVDTDVA